MSTLQTSEVQGSRDLTRVVVAGGLIVTAIGWTMVLAVVSHIFSGWPDLFRMIWLPIGYLIGALGISLFLLAASSDNPRKTPLTVAVIVLTLLSGLLAYGLLGPFGSLEQSPRLDVLESLGYAAAVPVFIALQMGLLSVAKRHPAGGYRSISRTLAMVYAVLFVISVSQLILTERLFGTSGVIGPS